ncbi:RNA polymerase II [Trichophaea hybrida]|nr:RNA polymerase II [Trichophaea hybrida]
MKVLEPKVGMLSNHEVLAHITAMKARYTELHHRVGGAHAMKAENLETVLKEVRDYLSHSPCALQTPKHISTFMAAMAPYALEKGELLQILNERPETIAELDCIIEEMEARFEEVKVQGILDVVNSTLPRRPKEMGEGEA